MARRVLFPDANIFLHCKFFTDLDWARLFPGDEIVLAICPAVFDELERIKFSGRHSARERSRAKSTVQRLGKLLLAARGQPVEFRKRCYVWATACEPQIDFNEHRLARDIPDDRILASVFDQKSKGDDANVVTGDVGMSMKALSRGLAPVQVPDEWKLEDEPDENEKELRELRRADAIRNAAAPNLRLTIGGNAVAEIEVIPTTLTDTQIAARIKGLRKRLPKLKRASTHSGLTMAYLSEPDARKVRDYNASLENHFEMMETYLANLHIVYARRDATVELRLALENTGALAAEDVDVILTTDAIGRWRSKPPPLTLEKPQPPTPPRSAFDTTYLDVGALRNIRSLASPSSSDRANAVLRELSPSGPREARFHVRLVKTGLPEELPILYFEFEPQDGATSFHIDYSLIAKNLSAPREGGIDIKIVSRSPGEADVSDA